MTMSETAGDIAIGGIVGTVVIEARALLASTSATDGAPDNETTEEQ